MSKVKLDKTSQEIRKLRDAVKKTTLELAKKNRELAIESSLERVRAVALTMKKPADLLNVCKKLFKELLTLDFTQLRNAIIHAFNDEEGYFTDYDYSDFTGGAITRIDYDANPVVKRFVRQIRVSDNAFVEFKITGKELADWKKFRIKGGQKDDLRLNKASAIHYYVYSVGSASIGISAFDIIKEEKLQLLRRFRNVFDFAYRRYLDVAQAEAQAREALVQLALEKVRARTMAMQKSDELLETSLILFQQLEKLGQPAEQFTIGIINEEKRVFEISATFHGNQLPHTFHSSIDEPYLTSKVYTGWKKKLKSQVLEIKGKDLAAYNKYRNELVGEKKFPTRISPNESWVAHVAYFSNGMLSLSSKTRLPQESVELLERFASVFDLTYTRFLDLKKAEAQAKESQIQLALERVRARTMAMQKSDELSEVVAMLHKQFEELDFGLYQILISIVNTEKKNIEWWSRGFGNTDLPKCYLIPFVDHPFPNMQMQKWNSGELYHAHILEGEMKKSWENYLFTQTDLKNFPEKAKKQMRSIDRVYCSDAFMKHGVLQAAGASPLSPDKADILIRFAKVLDQAYTRMKDLQNAEAQTREARIEAALERARAKAMAMHKTEDIHQAVAIVFEEMEKLNLGTTRCGIGILSKEKMTGDVWTIHQSDEGDKVLVSGNEAMDIHPLLEGDYKAWLNNEDFSYVLQGDDLVSYYKAVTESDFHLPESQLILEASKDKKQYYYVTPFESGTVFAFRDSEFPEEAKSVMKRFANVFNLTYKRFLDLQKAEAQTREAQIEVGLERVRAKAMAMHKSDDLNAAVSIVFEELAKLNLDVLRCGIGIMDKGKRHADVWVTTITDEGPVVQVSGDESFDIHPLLTGAFNAWASGEQEYSYTLEGQDLVDYYKALGPTNFHLPESQLKLSNIASEKQYYTLAPFEAGGLFAFRKDPFPDEAKDVMRRFASVFNLTYKRFLDIQKAEAQAREAQIEASLERVRAKAMAMHSSEELASTISTFYHEIEMLSVTPRRCGVAIMDKDTKIAELSTMNTTEEGNSLVVMGQIKMEGHRILDEAFGHWLQQKEYHATLRGPEISEYYRVLRPQIDFPDYPHDEVQYGYYFMFREGDVYAWTEKPLTEEQLKIYRRFTTVLSLTFKRYNDLKHAEAQTREANIEVALERVRARALAMQEPEELKDVAQVLRNEMGALGVEELETASIYIHDKDDGMAECWYALKDPVDPRKKMVADHFQVTLNDTWVGRKMKKFYLSDEKQVSIVMQGANRKEWIEYCYKRSPVFSGFYGETIPDRTYHLYKFSHGYIGAAAPGDISAESWKLLSRAASVFSLAYSRFKDLTQARNDLHRLKEEKQRAESALTELKSTQTQLIQAEKMASLGELTAGIAHEIQNPLNFVNNFSEVSNELITEMKEELSKGNNDGAIQLVEDVKQNLHKINFHGKRADAIVKSMLQHSRKSTGQKELTDINALADEYLRLAYHGFRAKDKSFNAKFEIHLDESIGKMNVVPQEIGRVILNLINNAFYAVSEKKKQNLVNYEPIVSVSTMKSNGNTEIKVHDNGNGIPQQALDKIFQPFFTTKPTGQGTGLGLSLSYDIITKGHGGELKVNTKEGEGTEFVIQLPS